MISKTGNVNSQASEAQDAARHTPGYLMVMVVVVVATMVMMVMLVMIVMLDCDGRDDNVFSLC